MVNLCFCKFNDKLSSIPGNTKVNNLLEIKFIVICVSLRNDQIKIAVFYQVPLLKSVGKQGKMSAKTGIYLHGWAGSSSAYTRGINLRSGGALPATKSALLMSPSITAGKNNSK